MTKKEEIIFEKLSKKNNDLIKKLGLPTRLKTTTESFYHTMFNLDPYIVFNHQDKKILHNIYKYIDTMGLWDMYIKATSKRTINGHVIIDQYIKENYTNHIIDFLTYKEYKSLINTSEFSTCHTSKKSEIENDIEYYSKTFIFGFVQHYKTNIHKNVWNYIIKHKENLDSEFIQFLLEKVDFNHAPITKHEFLKFALLNYKINYTDYGYIKINYISNMFNPEQKLKVIEKQGWTKEQGINAWLIDAKKIQHNEINFNYLDDAGIEYYLKTHTNLILSPTFKHSDRFNKNYYTKISRARSNTETYYNQFKQYLTLSQKIDLLEKKNHAPYILKDILVEKNIPNISYENIKAWTKTCNNTFKSVILKTCNTSYILKYIKETQDFSLLYTITTSNSLNNLLNDNEKSIECLNYVMERRPDIISNKIKKMNIPDICNSIYNTVLNHFPETKKQVKKYQKSLI